MTTHRRALVIAVASLVLTLAGCKIVPIDEGGKAITNIGVFDAKDYVERIWDSQVLPTFREEAIPVESLLTELDGDSEAALTRYGRQAAVGSAFTFIVEGRGVAGAGGAGTISVKLDGYDGPIDVAVRLGPAFTGTEIRDSLTFIRFNDFKNVLEYADVSTQLNARVRTSVIAGRKADDFIGRRVHFLGAFALRNQASVVVVPVVLEVEPQ